MNSFACVLIIAFSSNDTFFDVEAEESVGDHSSDDDHSTIGTDNEGASVDAQDNGQFTADTDTGKETSVRLARPGTPFPSEDLYPIVSP